MKDESGLDLRALEVRDWDLLDRAVSLLKKRWRPHWQQVAAAVRMESGNAYQAVNLDAHCGSCGVCAEPIAIGMGVAKGDQTIDTIVAVRKSSRDGPDAPIKLVTPCGACRELICDYGPNAFVILRRGDGYIKARARLLLPWKYDRDGA